MKRRTVFPIAGIALLLGSLALPFGAQSCSVTRNADGSWTASFAPDMIITANGLEEALRKLNELLEACLTGGFERDCTLAEIQEITDVMTEVIEKKSNSRLGAPPKAPTPSQRQPPAPQPG